LGSCSKIIGTKFISVEKNISMGRYAWIEAISFNNGHKFRPVIKIGSGFCASERLHISAINRIDIADNCLFGSCVYISDHNHGSYKGEEQSHASEPPIQRKLVSLGPVIIGSNVWVGDNVVIVGPVRIGNGVVIGANSVVTRDIPDEVMVVGIRAKIVKQFNRVSGQWEMLEKIST
jgi:lipopolysaccharide O-acetyltransferase